MISLISRKGMKINFIRVKQKQLFKPLPISPLPKSKSLPLVSPPAQVFFSISDQTKLCLALAGPGHQKRAEEWRQFLYPLGY